MHPPRLHPFFRLCLCALGLLGVQVLVTILCLGPILLSTYLKKQPLELAPDFLQRYALPIGLLSYPPSLLVIARCRRRRDKASAQSLGLRPIRVAPNLIQGAFGGTAAIGFLWAILWITGSIQVKGWSPELISYGFGAIVPLLGFLLAFGAVGVFEEVLFRGYILHNLSGWLGWRWGMALQAILFAVVHLGNVISGTNEERLAALGALPSIALVGLFFGLTARKTGTLWFAIGFHAAWDFALGCIFSLPVSGINTFRLFDVQAGANSWLSGGSFGAEGSFLLIPILLALIVFISLVPDHPQTLLDLHLSHWKRTPKTQTEPFATVPETPYYTSPSSEESTSEEARTNRYRARFGSTEGFDSNMLRELRSLQEDREREAKTRELETKHAQEKQLELAKIEAEVQALPSPIQDVEPLPVPALPGDREVRRENLEVATPTKESNSQTVAPSVAPPPSPTPVAAPSPPVAPPPTPQAPVTPIPPAPSPQPVVPPSAPPAPPAPQPSPSPSAPESAPNAPAKKPRPRW